MADWNISHKTKDGVSWVELRASYYRGDFMVFVGPNGWYHGKDEKPLATSGTWKKSTRDYDVRLGTNGPLFLTWEDWADIQNQIEKAKAMLDATV